MSLYSHQGKYPTTLPHRIILGNGKTRTDSSTFTAEEIESAGWVEAPEKPSFDPATHNPPLWSNDAWVENPKSVEQLAAEARKAARDSLKAQWEAMPDYIRGPYRPLFDAANALLDAGDDAAAIAMIEAAEANSVISADQLKLGVFTAAKAAFLQGVSDLP